MSDAVELLYRCKRIRAVEQGIAQRYAAQEMRCPTHLSIGQELVGAAVGMVLTDSDLAVSTHRAHAHYLGKGGDLKAMLAEIYGKETGCAKGRGGSMHLIDRSVGFEGSTAIVGNSIPVGVGLALSIQLDGDGRRIACVFVGDAVFETGVFYESMNFAATRNLPVLFVCENNLYSVYSPLSVRQPEGRSFRRIAESIGLRGLEADGTKALDTLGAVKEIAGYVRDERTPGFIEISAYRWREHCGPNFDNDLGYRTVEEYEQWRDKDAVMALERDLLDQGELIERDVKEINSKIMAEVEEAFKFAQDSAYPPSETAGDFQYAESSLNNANETADPHTKRFGAA